MRIGRPEACSLLLAWMLTVPVRAESLPHVAFSSADGLPSDEIHAAVQDPRGFVWLATGDGLARFDGRAFRVFGREHGLEDPFLLSLLPDADGAIWIGALGGVWRFDPGDGGRFTRVPLRTETRRFSVGTIARGTDGSLWASTRDGLFRMPPGGASFEPSPLDDRLPGEGEDVVVDGAGNLWYATAEAVLRVARDGTASRVGAAGSPEVSGAMDLHVDAAGRVWMSRLDGVCVVAEPSSPVPVCSAVPAEGLAGAFAGGFVEDRDGTLWVGSRNGIYRIDDETQSVSRFEGGHLQGEIYPLLADDRGGVWLAPREAGLERWSLSGIHRYAREDGLTSDGVRSIVRDRSGFVTIVSGDHVLHRWDGDRFVGVKPRFSTDTTHGAWGWGQVDFQDSTGRWWIATGSGALRYPPIAHLEDLSRVVPEVRLGVDAGLPGREVFRLWEDAAGDVWISTIDASPVGQLARWSRADGTIRAFGGRDGVPLGSTPSAFAQDPDGTLWIGFYDGRLARRRGEDFEGLPDVPGASQGQIPALLFDRAGRLWVATSRGLFRSDDPGASTPVYVRYGRSEGLGAERIRALVEDASGRIFVATAAGVDVLDPVRGVVRRLTRGDGLPAGLAQWLLFDGRDVWYGSTRGLARIEPEVAARRVPPDPVIDALWIGGRTRPVSAAGVTAISGLVLAADERQLQVDVAAPTADASEVTRFQHRIGEGPWSPPTGDRSLHFANVAPGEARLEIRAVSLDGVASTGIAAVSFRALGPWWKRPWFGLTAALTLMGVAALAYRARVDRLVALERQRTRIAMDLHDEIGSGLGSIGLLADLAADRSAPEDERARLADEVATIASELGSAMGEIVWSLRPGSETMEAFARHLVERARRIFPGGGAQLEIAMPDQGLSETISVAARRNAMLLALEALHNAARHAGATRVALRLARSGGRWSVSVSDDGRGLGATVDHGSGMGLDNMRRRAERIGAALDVAETPGGGTTVRLTFDSDAEDRGAP